MSKRFLLTLITIFIIGVGAALAIMLAKGYRFSPKDGTFLGTGILSITSVPDQASVYLDDHLTTATNANINNLNPKDYKVKITKDGFIPWEKKIAVNKGLVTEVNATLFRAIPTVYPLTYSGAQNAVLSDDGQKLVFVVPKSDEENPLTNRKKNGIWVWTMVEKQISFARGGEPHQIAFSTQDIDFLNAKFKFSPDSKQILVTLPNRYLLLDTDRFNDPPKDVTAIIDSTLKSWQGDEIKKELTRRELIKDLSLRKSASESAVAKWSPDETKILLSKNGKGEFKVLDILTRKSFDLPGDVQGYGWLPDSEHLVLVEAQIKEDEVIVPGKISIIEYDGNNKSEIYAGNFDPNSVFAWPDSSRLVIISSLPTATASKPNLFGINLK